MRTATVRPLQQTRNDRLRHSGGSLGSIPSTSPMRARPAKPGITACHNAPNPAMRTPPALLGSRSRSVAAVFASTEASAAGRHPRVHPRTERAAVGTARLVMAEIRLRHYIGEFFGQQRDQRHYV